MTNEEMEIAIGELLAELRNCDGACLYWQLSNPKLALEMAQANLIGMVDDLAIHPDAITIEHGACYRMPDNEHRGDHAA